MFPHVRTSHARMYFVEGRFYVLFGMGEKLDAFFDSFKLLSKRALSLRTVVYCGGF
jgi:hypothetical protein